MPSNLSKELFATEFLMHATGERIAGAQGKCLTNAAQGVPGRTSLVGVLQEWT